MKVITLEESMSAGKTRIRLDFDAMSLSRMISISHDLINDGVADLILNALIANGYVIHVTRFDGSQEVWDQHRQPNVFLPPLITKAAE